MTSSTGTAGSPTTARRNLKLITTTHRPVVDLYGPWRAEIEARDWDAVQIAADKRQPVEISDTRKGWSTWLKRKEG